MIAMWKRKRAQKTQYRTSELGANLKVSYVSRTLYGFLVSKKTVVLRRWERSKQKFGFMKRVDKGWITTVKDLGSWRFER